MSYCAMPSVTGGDVGGFRLSGFNVDGEKESRVGYDWLVPALHGWRGAAPPGVLP